MILAAARRLVASGSPVGVELLFTTCEELQLHGAKEFDLSRLQAEFGFVFDHASPIGARIIRRYFHLPDISPDAPKLPPAPQTAPRPPG